MRVGTGLVPDDELEIVGRLVDDHACVGVAVVDDLAQVIPRMFFHLELGGVHVLHLHHLGAVRELVHPRHRCQSRSDPVGTRRERIFISSIFSGITVLVFFLNDKKQDISGSLVDSFYKRALIN